MVPLILGSNFLTRALRFVWRMRLLYNLYSLLERQWEGFIKLIMLYRLAIFLASLSSPFMLAVFSRTLVILLSSY